jgi:hypothetical protein
MCLSEAPFARPLTVPADATFPDLARGVVGSWVKLLAFAPDLSAFNIYLGNVVHNVGYPQSFIDEIDKTVGFWPAEPDFFNLERALIDEATYMEATGAPGGLSQRRDALRDQELRVRSLDGLSGADG